MLYFVEIRNIIVEMVVIVCMKLYINVVKIVGCRSGRIICLKVC